MNQMARRDAMAAAIQHGGFKQLQVLVRELRSAGAAKDELLEDLGSIRGRLS